jgi:phosphoribosylformimino-5-aminoimidazole carboxamide ribotide isomerase
MNSLIFKRFTVIPAIDLKDGKVVRLMRGEMNQATTYSEDPTATARLFEQGGADLLHVVDLDGAVAGEPRNRTAISAIRRAVNCRLDVSGGLRSIESVRQTIAAGSDFVSIGSAAFLNPELVKHACEEFPGRVIGSVDARDGRLAVKGWVETSRLSVLEAIVRFRSAGVAAVTLTDITRDGTQTGADAALFAAIAAQAGVPLIASGGVATLDDLRALARLFDSGVVGAITGRALYEGRFSLGDAIAATR